MKKQLQSRLLQLQQEYQKGEEQLKQLELEANNLRTSMLRISGAIQVIKEELEKSEQTASIDMETEVAATNHVSKKED